MLFPALPKGFFARPQQERGLAGAAGHCGGTGMHRLEGAPSLCQRALPAQAQVGSARWVQPSTAAQGPRECTATGTRPCAPAVSHRPTPPSALIAAIRHCK